MDESVDVLREREQERRARLQLLDDIREPSPQPIFGEPVKVDLEDETSRRIKNTLGDFTQVLVNDPKNLIGISRSTPVNPLNGAAVFAAGSSAHGAQRNQAVLKKPPFVPMAKPSIPNHISPKGPDKRPKVQQSPAKPSAGMQPCQVLVRDAVGKNQRNSVPVVETSVNNNGLPTSAPIWNSGPPAVTPIYLPTSATPSVPCKDAVKQIKTNDPTKNESATPAKRNNGRPSNLKIQPEKNSSTDAPIAVETILKQMTDVVAPLTGIQTPRKEETGFVFSAKQENSSVSEDKDVAVPLYTKLPLPKPLSPKLQKKQPEPLPVAATKDSEKPVSLQDDLAVSDSDEEVVPELKINPAQCLKSPVNDSNVIVNPPLPTNNNTMDDNSAESSNSSSSEDSDSDDSSSESNDSDSSSGVSDEEISSKKWGLSNFVDESQRIHSPAFFPVDTPKESVQLNAEKVKNVSLNNVNPVNGPSLTQVPFHQPATEETPFLVPDVPVTSKSEILSPIPSPVHTQVGPRTPPSPPCSIKQDFPETNKNDAESLISQSENKSCDEIPSLPIKSSPHSDDNRDISANKGNVQNEKCKKQLRSSKLKEQNSEGELSKAVSVEESSKPKENPGMISDKSRTVTGVDSLKSSVDASVTSEPCSENYPIKTRQRVSARRKSTLDNSNESVSKLEEENSAIAKLKHPRACRKFAEKQNKKSTLMKVKPSEESKKNTKQETKDTSSISEKIKTPVVAANTTNPPKPTKTSKRSKGKNSKVPPKQSLEVEKPDNKKKKFAIKNFVQNSENEGIKPPSLLSPFTPSPVRSPVPEVKKNSENPTEQTSVSSVSSKPHGKSTTNNPVKAKKVEKLRRSVRCSERASNNAQTDSSTTQQTPDGTGKKRNSKASGKRKHSPENVLISIEPPVELLSPIPHDPSSSSQSSDCGIPNKVMVCIPLNMLSRIPSGKPQPQESTSRLVSKSTSSSDEAKSQKKDNTEKALKKNSTLKGAQSKDKIKATPVSIKVEKTNSKKLKAVKKEVKPILGCSSKTNPVSNVNKNIKVKDKTVSSETENILPKKRKNETKEKQIVKKPKLSSQQTEDRKPKELPSVVKTEPTTNYTNDGNKSKMLERCDSTGSLSSLCSQQSQKSSKSLKDRIKDSSTGAPESKRMKTSSGTTLLSVKDIKQEKTERTKGHSTIDKNIPSDKKNKSKDKLGLIDVVDQIVDESFSSSQYRLFEDSCKEEPKGKMLGSNPNVTEPENRDLVDWHNFAPEMHKEMKEASTLNKHNPQAPVMPMDYYFTEGKKQKLTAEKEKDPFQQAVKYFEAAVLFILTSQQREEYSKDPVSVYQFYYETLKFSSFILSKVKKLQTCPGSTEFKLLILCLKCQSLLSVKLYNLKIKEIKEQLDGVAEFLRLQCPSANPLKNQSHQSRFPSIFSIPSPHSTIPSPASNSQNSSSDRNQTVSVPQSILDTLCRQHTHLINLHRGHDLWEQADMYMTRSNLREFFKEVADQLEPLTLHSSITELVKYIQKGISLIKKSLR